VETCLAVVSSTFPWFRLVFGMSLLDIVEMMPVSKAASVVSTRDGTETPFSDNEEPDEAFVYNRTSPHSEECCLSMRLALDLLEPMEVLPLCPPPGLKLQVPLAISRSGHKSGSVYQAHWAVDPRKFVSKERQIVSPPFDFPLANSDENATFRIMLHAVDKSSERMGASFKTTRGRGHVQLKCETPDVESISFRVSIGNGMRLPSRGFSTHHFSDSTVCSLPKGGEVMDFNTAVEKGLGVLTICLEVSHGPRTPSSDASGEAKQWSSRSSPGNCVYSQLPDSLDGLSPEAEKAKQRALKRQALAATADSERQSQLAVPVVSFKTQPCRFFMSAKGCAKGAACTYAHGEKELPAEGSNASTNYKTRMCAIFAKAGTCSLGKHCTFAHGIADLRAPVPTVEAPSKKQEKLTADAKLVAVSSHLQIASAMPPSYINPADLLTRPMAFCQNRTGPWSHTMSGTSSAVLDPLMGIGSDFVSLL